MATILGEGKVKKTRKAHHCCVCEERIDVGSTCHWQTNDGFGEADFGTAYWHEDCDEREIAL